MAIPDHRSLAIHRYHMLVFPAASAGGAGVCLADRHSARAPLMTSAIVCNDQDGDEQNPGRKSEKLI